MRQRKNTDLNRRRVLFGGSGALAAALTASCQSRQSQPASEIIELENAESVLHLRPALGGAITHYRFAEHDILRPSPADITDVRSSAHFAMVPMCNRIANAGFEFEGETVKLTPNHFDQIHHVHGLGWQTAWQIVSSSNTRAQLEFRHERSEWPWRFAAKQKFKLGPTHLRLDLEISNLDNRPMPASLGFHPYFPRTNLTRIQTMYDGHWPMDEDKLALPWQPGPAGRDFRALSKVAGARGYDTTHSNFSGQAEIVEPGRPIIQITASESLDKVHIFSPLDRAFFCIEPVMNHPTPFRHENSGVKSLAPGETLKASMQIQILA